MGGGDSFFFFFFWQSGFPLTPTWSPLFTVKVTSARPESQQRLCEAPSWHVEPHIDHITCPRQTDNKVQDVSFCRTTQEMSSNWRLRERTRQTRVLKTKSLHAYYHELRFFRGADSRLSNQFIEVFFSHIFLALFPYAGGKGVFVGIWTRLVSKCAE